MLLPSIPQSANPVLQASSLRARIFGAAPSGARCYWAVLKSAVTEHEGDTETYEKQLCDFPCPQSKLGNGRKKILFSAGYEDPAPALYW